MVVTEISHVHVSEINVKYRTLTIPRLTAAVAARANFHLIALMQGGLEVLNGFFGSQYPLPLEKVVQLRLKAR